MSPCASIWQTPSRKAGTGTYICRSWLSDCSQIDLGKCLYHHPHVDIEQHCCLLDLGTYVVVRGAGGVDRVGQRHWRPMRRRVGVDVAPRGRLIGLIQQSSMRVECRRLHPSLRLGLDFRVGDQRSTGASATPGASATKMSPLFHSPAPTSGATPAMPIRTIGTQPYLAIHCVSKPPPPPGAALKGAALVGEPTRPTNEEPDAWPNSAKLNPKRKSSAQPPLGTTLAHQRRGQYDPQATVEKIKRSSRRIFKTTNLRLPHAQPVW